MSASGFTPISIYYSTTASAVPTAANLVQGELAINTNDGKLYYEDSAGVVQVLATKSTGSIGGSNTQVQFNNSGSLGGSSSFTWDGTTVTATKFAGALNGTVGATTPSTGAFTTLTSNGATTFTAGTASTSTTTGTTVITGGLGVSGRINAANFDGIVGANTAAAGSFTILSATGVATFSAGTVSLPAITTTGDTNTGIYFPAADTIAFTEGGAESMRIDSSGNLGLGVTPSAWNTASKALQLSKGSLYSRDLGSAIVVANNAYFNSSSNNIYINTDFASDYLQTGGQHIWRNAASGTAGNTISFTQAMTLDASGNLGIGTTSPTSKLHVKSAGSGTVALFGDSEANNTLAITRTVSNEAYMAIAASSFAGTITAGIQLILNTSTNTGGSVVERVRLDQYGNFLIGKTSATANGGILQVSNGITFPATQVALSDANTLDDYEEGTWTPNQGAGLTVVGTFSSSGTYTKVGRVVTITGFVAGSTSVAVTASGVITSNPPFNTATEYTGTSINNAINASAGNIIGTNFLYSASAIAATPKIFFSVTYTV